LDELPQIWSVFVGDMSLVGPRPYLEREIPEMNGQEAIILRVKPGITGIWQVTERNASSFEARVQLDVEYVRSWSPWLDLYVLARTLPVVLGGTGS
jgi:lipopolysaccharide/colanic/teichoic acid biosynthesis glycosyltransferase